MPARKGLIMDSALAERINKIAPRLFSDVENEAEAALASLRQIVRPQIEIGTLHISDLSFGLKAALPALKTENIMDLVERNTKPLKSQISSLQRQLSQKTRELQDFVLREGGVDISFYETRISALEKEVVLLRALNEKSVPEVPEPPKKVTINDLSMGAASKRPLGGATPLTPGRNPKLDITAQRTYREPVIKLMRANGGQMHIRRIKEQLPRILEEASIVLKAGDLIPSHHTKPHETKWMNQLQWERAAMIADGILKSDSPRGVWELVEFKM